MDGKLCILRNFTFRSVSNPFSLPPGSYDVRVSLANSVSPCGNAPVARTSLTLVAGEEAAVVAALSPLGKPVLDAFALDLSLLAEGQGRVIVAHAAAAPAVTVSVDGKRAIRGLAPGSEAAAVLPTGAYSVEVFPGGQATSVIGPVTVGVGNRTATLAFAAGSVASGSITLVVVSVPGVF